MPAAHGVGEETFMRNCSDCSAAVILVLTLRARIRYLENLLKAIMEERDDAIEVAKVASK